MLHTCARTLAGVSAVGVALVASAAKGMASKLCATRLLAVICTAAAVIAYYWPKAYTFPVLIAAGGLATLGSSLVRKEALPAVNVRSVHITFCQGTMLCCLCPLGFKLNLHPVSPSFPLPFPAPPCPLRRRPLCPPPHIVPAYPLVPFPTQLQQHSPAPALLRPTGMQTSDRRRMIQCAAMVSA